MTSPALTYKDSPIWHPTTVLHKIITPASAYSFIYKQAASVFFTPPHSGEKQFWSWNLLVVQTSYLQEKGHRSSASQTGPRQGLHFPETPIGRTCR